MLAGMFGTPLRPLWLVCMHVRQISASGKPFIACCDKTQLPGQVTTLRSQIRRGHNMWHWMPYATPQAFMHLNAAPETIVAYYVRHGVLMEIMVPSS